MQEALQQLQVLTGRIATLETQLQFESARAQTGERERSALIESLGAMRTDRGDAMVDTKGIGQSFMLKGTADQDFGEWTHKVRTFMLARFGDEILAALTWAARQRKVVVKTCVASQRETALYLGSLSLENKPPKTRSTTLMTLLDNTMLTLCLLQPTQPTGSSGTLEKEMAWKLGDDCTASTTRRRP